MTHILYILPEEYKNIVENLEDSLDDDVDMIMIETIWEKLSSKYNIMNAQYQKTNRTIVYVIYRSNQENMPQLW